MLLLGTQRVNARGRLEIGGCDTVELAAEFGTPLYVMDETAIRSACRAYRSAFETRYPANSIHYAGKAFLCLAMCRIVQEEGLGLDVASAGELYTALRAGFPTERINLHGNNKSVAELELAVRSRVGHITVDSFREIEMLADVLARRRAHAPGVLVRCAPGVDPDTHRFISTGQADTKFGLNIADGSAIEAVRRVAALPRTHFRGIHFHVGSQLLDAESHLLAIDAAVELMADIRNEIGADCQVLNIGGGLGVRYTSDSTPASVDDFADAVIGRLATALLARGLPRPTLAQEPGRAIVGEAGTTLYSVGAIKTVRTLDEPGFRTYAAVDGGLSDNPRPQLYDARYEIVCASRAADLHETTVTIAGKHCETDVLIWDAKCAALEAGDIVAVQTTGAYNHSMASNYNRFQRPAVVLVANGSAEVIVRRETLRDMVRNDCLPARLSPQRPGPRT